jgi:hypothetical protein
VAGIDEGCSDLVAQSDFDDVFKHEELEEIYDVSHLWPRMDSISDSETDRRSMQSAVNMSSERNLLIHTTRTGPYHYDDCEPPHFNASQYVASTTFNEYQCVQADFDELQ